MYPGWPGREPLDEQLELLAVQFGPGGTRDTWSTGTAAGRSVKELTAAIGAFIDAYNDRCRSFTWTKDADQLIGISGRQE